MNNKGFTLTEMLAVIIVISIIGMVAVPAIINSVKSNNIDTYNSMINDIVLTAQSYATNAGGSLVQVSVSTLQSAGYLTKKINPIDNTELKGCVYISNGQSYYKEEDCKTIIAGIGAPIDVCEYAQGHVWEFDFEGNGGEERFIVPCTGTYILEVWGAQGGSVSETIHGGYGGYATGNIDLIKNEYLYVNVGGSPTDVATLDTSTDGGYNGGGASTKKYDLITNAGGGATHIAKRQGLLNTFTRNDSDLLIVAGGGGGASAYNTPTSSRNGIGGSGGGYIGGQGIYNNDSDCDGYGSGGTQTSGGTYYTVPGHLFGVEFDMPETGFGFGGAGYGPSQPGGSGGGGGYYGGSGMVCNGGAGGGSGYIGNSRLYDKHMTCYSCGQTENENTRTISVNTNTDISLTAVSDKVKKSNGHARITLGNSTASSLQDTYITVTFDANGGTVDIPNKQVVYGQTYGNLPEPRRDGYTFQGWNGNNLFDGLFKTGYLDFNTDYTNTSFSNRNLNYSDLEDLYYTFGGNFKAGTYTFTINSTDHWYSINRIAIAGTNSYGTMIHVRNSYTWTQNVDGYTYFSIERDDGVSSYTDTAFDGYDFKVQIEEGSTSTAYEPYYIEDTTTVVQGVDHTLTAIWEEES